MKTLTKSSIISLLTATILTSGGSALACDLCGIYTAQNIRDAAPESVTAGLVEQFTAFNSTRLDGEKVANTEHQSLSSSITQLYARYDLSDQLGIQANLPFIRRTFKRIEEMGLTRGEETGIGDASIIALYSPLKITENDLFVRLTFRGGVELPTGDTDRISEELAMEHNPTDEHSGHDMEGMSLISKHAGEDHGDSEVSSAVHGHDLALGSGSYDYVFGANAFVEKGLNFFLADLQYVVRTEGDYDYRYANDIVWLASVGRYLAVDHDYSTSLRVNLSGEYKGKDKMAGMEADDTGITSVFVGPEINATWQEQTMAFLAVDLPVSLENTAYQIVPDYRVRIGLTYRF